MIQILKQILISALFILFNIGTTNAQKIFTFRNANSKLVISGTSNVHNWQMESSILSGEACISVDDHLVTFIEKASLSILVSDIKSQNSIMDKKAHKALSSEKHTEIYFTLSKFTPYHIEKEGGELTGLLTIAGTSQKIKLDIRCKSISENEIFVQGEVPLKMSDFGVKAPSALGGVLKTSDDIVVKLNFALSI